MEQNVFYAWNVLETVQRMHFRTGKRLPHCHHRRGALFYASISIVMPDLNSMVKWSAKTVIFSMSFLTRASSNSVMSLSCPEMKSCSSLIRFMASSRWWLSSSDCSFWSCSRKISSAMAP